jgi:hypothetical protein
MNRREVLKNLARSAAWSALAAHLPGVAAAAEFATAGLCVDLSVNWGAVRPPGLAPFLSQP